MKRYNPTAYMDDGIALVEMTEAADGKYIKHEDVRQKLEIFDEMLLSLRETRKAMQIAGGDFTCARLDRIITRARVLQEASK